MREEHGGAMQKPGAAASYSPPRSQVLSELVAVALALRTATSLFDYLLAATSEFVVHVLRFVWKLGL